MQLPNALLQSLQGLPGFDEDAFVAVHAHAQPPTSVRINTAKFTVADAVAHFNELGIETEPVPWCESGLYLSKRPSFTFDPLFHAGCYYVQEASSMFAGYLLQQHAPLHQPLHVLDLSAAPGGKSTHLQNLLSPQSLLVCNEVVKSRAGVLKENVIKWGVHNVVVTQNDPADFSRLPSFFDVMLVDAPCSGSGLFRRDEAAVQEWSSDAVNFCSARQRRILADALPALKDGGLLIYSTCSYSFEENEAVVKMLAQQGFTPLATPVDAAWGLVESQGGSYRFYPYKLGGEGFFAAAFRKTGGSKETHLPQKKLMAVNRNDASVLQNHITLDGYNVYAFGTALHAWPQHLHVQLAQLTNALRTQYAGVLLGEVVHQKLVPEHALAISMLSHTYPGLPLCYDDAIAYLQRGNLSTTAAGKGWHTAIYKHKALGWCNMLPNRINNYYPKGLRILKASAGSDLRK